MSENSNIQWTDHTGGPFLGCTEVSPGCLHCYARDLMLARLFPIMRKAYQRAGFTDWQERPVWGDKAPRVLTKGFWNQARFFNNKARKENTRFKMFPSMIDWLDEMPAGILNQDGEWLDPISVLSDFLDLIRATPHLDWILLTKRPENFFKLLDRVLLFTYGSNPDLSDWLRKWLLRSRSPSNVWIMASMEDQLRADQRMPHLLKIPAVVRGVSYEPALGPIDFPPYGVPPLGGPVLHWIIVGGESGSGARPFDIAWARSTIAQSRAGGIACFVKQVGRDPQWSEQDMAEKWYENFADPKGGNISEWPLDIRVRQFPSPSVPSVPSVSIRG